MCRHAYALSSCRLGRRGFDQRVPQAACTAPACPTARAHLAEAFTLCTRSLCLLQLLSEAELEQLLDRNHVFADDLASGADAGGACSWTPCLCLCWLLNQTLRMDGSGMVGKLC